MAVKRFPVEAGHVLMFARSIGDPNPVYADEGSEAARAAGGLLAPPTFVQAGAQFDPDYPLRPQPGRPWFGSGRNPSGLPPRGAPGAGGRTAAEEGRAVEGREASPDTGSGPATASEPSPGARSGTATVDGSGARTGTSDDSGRPARARRSGGGGGLHAEQHYRYHRTPRVGDVLTATTTPGKRWEKEGRRAGKLAFSETVTEYRDQHGELVVTARMVGVRTERPAEARP